MTAGLPEPLCGALEVALNRYLALDPDSGEALARLDGRRLAVTLDPPDWTLHIEFMGGGVRVSGEAVLPPEVRVSGAPSLFARLAGGQMRGGGALPRGLRVEGDPELLLRFQALLADIGFDLAEILEPWLGDIAAQRVADTARGLFGWGRRALQTLGLDAVEYLREESGDLAHGDDVRAYMDAVDDVRDHAERLQARVARLERRLPAGGVQPQAEGAPT